MVFVLILYDLLPTGAYLIINYLVVSQDFKHQPVSNVRVKVVRLGSDYLVSYATVRLGKLSRVCPAIVRYFKGNNMAGYFHSLGSLPRRH